MEQTISIPSGIWPVMLTPFDGANEVDQDALEALIEYYLEEGVAGLYAVCASSEFLNLSQEEILNLPRAIVRILKGRIPVVATGNFGPTLEAQAQMMQRMVATGVDAVIISTSLLPKAEELADQILLLSEGLDLPLGVYECPIPEHRTLSVEEVERLAQTGRFHVLKETSRDKTTYLAKVEVSRETPLRVFQANLKTLFATGNEYGHGFMGCLANVAPFALNRYLSLAGEQTPERQQTVDFLTKFEAFMYAFGYPASAKYILQYFGLPLTSNSRWSGMELTKESMDEMQDVLEQWSEAFHTHARIRRLRIPLGGWPILEGKVPWAVTPAQVLD